jgi:hypothetical protein
MLLSVASGATTHPSFSFWIPAATHSLSGIWDHAEQLSFEESLGLEYQQQQQYQRVQQPSTRLLQTGDDDGEVLYLTLEFSLWYPAMQGKVVTSPTTSTTFANSEFFMAGILGLLRDFLCEDTTENISVVHALNASQSMCRGVEGYREDLEGDLGLFQAVHSTIRSNQTESETQVTLGTVVVSDQMENNMEWMSWEVTYQLVQVGQPFWQVGAASTSNTDGGGAASLTTILSPEFETSIQDTLDLRIQQQSLNQQLREYLDSSRAQLSIVGQEVETFSGSALSLEQDYSYSQDAKILQAIGIGLMILVTWLFIMLTGTARRRRLDLERQEQVKEKARLRREEQEEQHYPQEAREQHIEMVLSDSNDTQETELVLLATEDDVNRMLFLGRRESTKAMRGSSLFLKLSAKGLKVTDEL